MTDTYFVQIQYTTDTYLVNMFFQFRAGFSISSTISFTDQMFEILWNLTQSFFFFSILRNLGQTLGHWSILSCFTQVFSLFFHWVEVRHPWGIGFCWWCATESSFISFPQEHPAVPVPCIEMAFLSHWIASVHLLKNNCPPLFPLFSFSISLVMSPCQPYIHISLEQTGKWNPRYRARCHLNGVLSIPGRSPNPLPRS